MDSNDDVNALHRTVAVEALNRSWDLIDKPDRSPAEEAELLTTVFASRFHWKPIGDDENKIAERDRYVGLANTVLEKVDDPEDRELIESQLSTIP